MAYVFVADDFTGASDTLATLARGGYRARLFRDLPSEPDVAGLDAWGIATDARSLNRAAIGALAARIGTGLAGHAPDFLHVKVCSTFDSGRDIGNTALFAQGLADATGIARIAVIGGQPSLGRYAIFGTLFARGPDGLIHRIDRHPVMSQHPVTPMHDADLIRHFAHLGLNGLRLVPRGATGRDFPRFYDALDQADVAAAGADLMTSGPVVAMGASSVAEGWIAARPPRPHPVLDPSGVRGPIFAFAGSRSSLTTSQIAAADGIACLPLNPADVMAEGEALSAAAGWAKERLARGQDCIVFLTAETSGAIEAADLARQSAQFVKGVLAARIAGALVVAGGDTSSAIVNALAPAHLDYAGVVCAGVPILRAGSGPDGLLLALKGGQMGPVEFFPLAFAALRGADAITQQPRATAAGKG